MAETSTTYPVHLSIDYPDRPLNRLTTFFRLFTFLPILIIITLLAGSSSGWDGDGGGASYGYAAGGVVFFPLILMLLFRQKYPRWWFDWNLALVKFIARVGAYLGLLTDVYPSTDEEQSVHIEIPYPDAKNDLHPGLPLVKWWLLAVPHYIILPFLLIAAVVAIVIAWFAILFTARYPRGLFDFVVGFFRWTLRVGAYALLLTTDRYPPFTLND